MMLDPIQSFNIVLNQGVQTDWVLSRLKDSGSFDLVKRDDVLIIGRYIKTQQLRNNILPYCYGRIEDGRFIGIIRSKNIKILIPVFLIVVLISLILFLFFGSYLPKEMSFLKYLLPVFGLFGYLSIMMQTANEL